MKSIFLIYLGAAVAISVLHAQTEVPSTIAAPADETVEMTGTVSGFTPGIMAVRTATQAHPIRFGCSKLTKWVDEDGKTILREALKTGTNVRVVSMKHGNTYHATKVTVLKPTPVPAPSGEQK